MLEFQSVFVVVGSVYNYRERVGTGYRISEISDGITFLIQFRLLLILVCFV